MQVPIAFINSALVAISYTDAYVVGKTKVKETFISDAVDVGGVMPEGTAINWLWLNLKDTVNEEFSVRDNPDKSIEITESGTDTVNPAGNL